MEAVNRGNLWRGAASQSTAALAVDEGSLRMQSTEAIFGGEQRRGQQQHRRSIEAFDGGICRRQSTEAIFGGEHCHGQQQHQQGGTEAVDGGLNFYYWQVSVERESKIAIFCTVQFYMHKNCHLKQSPTK